MAVMSTSTRELDISTLVLTAYQYAGLMSELQTAEGEHWDARRAYACRQLETIVDALGAEGIFERSMEYYDLAVAAGDASTQMPLDTIDVRGNASVLQDDNSEFELAPLSRSEYFELTIKAVEGVPAKFYLSRGAPMYLYLWPVPDADITVRLQRQKLTFDNSAGASTVDLERYWMDYLLHELASRLALSSGVAIERVAVLKAGAQAAKNLAKGKSSSQLENQFVMDHRGPWSGRR